MKKIFTITCILCGLIPWSFAQNGLNFDGVNDIVQTTYTGVLGSADRTFEAWVYVPSSAPSSNLAIIDYGLNAVGSRNSFSVSGSRGLTFISGGTNANISSPANTVPINQWVHVAFVLNSGTGYLYVNSVQVGTGLLTTVNTPSGNQNVRIGQRVSGGTIPFNGSIDEVRVWDVARTSAELQANMNSEFCSFHPSLKLNLQFNEGTAGGTNTGITSAPDNSGYGHNGTLSNFSLTGTISNWVTGSGIAAGTSSTDVQMACGSYTWIDGNIYTSNNNTATHILMNAQGCDSTITLDLTINNSTSGTDMQVACGSYTWIDGNTYTSNNSTATHTITNTAGCDSLVTLNLTINNSSASTDAQVACDSYIWIDGNTYASNNDSATYTLTNFVGCDSIIRLDLTINTIDTSVTQNEAVLMANATGTTYQWVTCPAMTPIFGATNQTFTAITDGNYAVILTNNQCSDTSACYNVNTLKTTKNQFGNDLQLFPNPTNGDFFIDMGEMYHTITVTIMDLTGKLIQSNIYNNRQLLNLTLNKPAGVYLLRIEAEDKQTIIKLVKQ